MYENNKQNDKLKRSNMKKLYKLTVIATALLLLFALASSSSAQTVVYVASDGSGDGSSWATASGSIQDAIQAAEAGTEIWIKGGTYYVPGDSTFNLKEGVSLYGGFDGTETSPIQRTDYRPGGSNETILSGDIDENGITDPGNTNRVMYGKDITSATTLSMLTITGGYAIGTSDDGGGLRLSNGSPIVVDCAIVDNYSDDNGAGFYIATTSLPTFTGCLFFKNYAADKGGAGYTATDCNAVFTNCIFTNNSAVNDGGAVRVYKSSPSFINCNFTRNSLPGAGDGSAVEINNAVSAPVFTNSVFWGNTEFGVLDDDITLTSSGTVILTNCAMEGTYTVTGATVTGLVDISVTDPLFMNTAGTSGNTGFDAAADWSLQTGSPLINAGLVAGAPLMDVVPNFRDATPDIGAFEYNGTVPLIVATDITGMGTVDPRGIYLESGSDQLFTLTPASGWELTSATYDAADIMSVLTDNGDGSFSYTAAAITANGLLAVTFEALAAEYVVTVSAGSGGSIAPMGDTAVTVSDEVVFTITPDNSFVFGDLLLNDVSVAENVVDNTDGTFTYTLSGVSENSTLVASFEELFTVTISAGANGSIDPTGSIDVSISDETVFNITANTGFVLATCTLNSVDVMANVVDNGDGTYNYTLTGVDADATVDVTFAEIVANIVYITEDGTGDGSSWANASGNLQAAIDAGTLGDEVWVAKGSYLVPTDTSFTLKSGVSIYGGFAGTESSKDERSNYRMGKANETTLTADVDGNGYLTGGNAPRVVYGEFISAMTTVDGFTINGGYSDVASSNGAGMKLRASSPHILNCTFYDNYCDDGAALYLYRSGDNVSSPIVENCFFIKGLANDDGGAIYNASGTRAQYINCVFANNEAKDEGGAVRNFECSPAFINCTFVHNSLPDADPNGGGTYGPAIRNYQGSSPYMNTEPDFINCLFWGNVDGTAEYAYEISNTGNMATAGVFARVVNCAIMDSLSSSSCIVIDTLNLTTENPGFKDVSGEAGYMGYSAAANWGLTEGCRMIGEGTNAEPGVPAKDITGKNRGDIIDIGAYEYESAAGIGNLERSGFDMEVYPNPARSSFTVKVELGIVQEIALYDMTGRNVYRNSQPGSGPEFSVSIDNQEGLYLLRVSKANGEVSTRKVLIVR